MNKITDKVLSWCVSQSPWQQRGFVFFLGILSVLSLAPFYLLPILFVTLSLYLFVHAQTNSFWNGFFLSWWFGFGYFTAGLYWIAAALFVDFSSFWWVIPFAVMGLPFALSFFFAIAGGLLTKLSPLSQISYWLCFVVLFGLTEWLRGHLFTGFPWNLMGYAWVDYHSFLQVGSLIGVYGLTAFTFLLFSSPYLFFKRINYKKPIALVFCLTLALFFFGQARLNQISTLPETDTILRLVQPNIAQRDKWDPKKMTGHFQRLVSLSSQPSEKDIAAIIWPETATAFFDTFSLRQFETSLPHFVTEGHYLITGVLDYGRDHNGQQTAYNRLGVFNHKSEMIDFYDKHHLVPFGEYLPFASLWPINPIASNGLMFTPGDGAMTKKIKNLPPFSPLICYEVLFPNAVVNKTYTSPEWLLNITNDAWYGYTIGPFQHLAISQMRAVEEGLPLVRIANTGISAMINAAGEITQALPLEKEGIIDAALPEKTTTLYRVFGDTFFFVFLGLLSLIAVLLRSKPNA